VAAGGEQWRSFGFDVSSAERLIVTFILEQIFGTVKCIKRAGALPALQSDISTEIPLPCFASLLSREYPPDLAYVVENCRAQEWWQNLTQNFTTTAFFISIMEQLPRNDLILPKVPENVIRWSLLSFRPNSFVIGNCTSGARNNSPGGSNVT